MLHLSPTKDRPSRQNGAGTRLSSAPRSAKQLPILCWLRQSQAHAIFAGVCLSRKHGARQRSVTLVDPTRSNLPGGRMRITGSLVGAPGASLRSAPATLA
jgi:hypothetical protein